MPNQILLNQVVGLAEKVAGYQLEKFRSRPPGSGDEKTARELVSEVDLTSERMLIDGLSQLLPDAGFHGEETGHSGNRDWRWIIDPLDGTTNYLSGLEQFCISVALYDREECQLGVVLRPASHELFSACRGQGLRHNGKPAAAAPAALPLSAALLGSGFPYRSPDLADSFFACARETLYKCRGLRRFGSAALDLSYVAAGFLQGFWESDLQPYDVAAALLFLQEAGCTVSNQRGERYRIGSDRILVCAPEQVYRELLPIISRHYAALGS
jgi:myo-inositol-1(or 4)-monophosphatase